MIHFPKMLPSWFQWIDSWEFQVPGTLVSINPFGIQGCRVYPKRYHFVTTAFGRPPGLDFRIPIFRKAPPNAHHSVASKNYCLSILKKGHDSQRMMRCKIVLKLRKLQLLCPRSLIDYMDSLCDLSSNVFLQSWNLSKYTMSCCCVRSRGSWSAIIVEALPALEPCQLNTCSRREK